MDRRTDRFFAQRRYRVLAWMYVVPVAVYWASKGRFYYVAEAYPALLAMGAAVCERSISWMPTLVRRSLVGVYFAGLALGGAYIFAAFVPVASAGPLRDFALKNSTDLREEIGWNDLVRTVAGIRDSLSPEQRAHLGITTANYGEYGAVEILGRAYGLPQPIGTTNSEWYRGYPDPPPTTLIVLGLSSDEANSLFTGCRLAGHNGNSLGVRNEESVDHPDIFLCGPPRIPWARIWREHRDFG